MEKLIIDQLHKSKEDQLRKAVRLGLSKHGFEFTSDVDFIEFIKKLVTIHDYTHLSEKVFFVKGSPFLKWNYKSVVNMEYKDRSVNLTAEFGGYYYIPPDEPTSNV